RRRAAEKTDLESGILQPIADSIFEIWGFPTLPVAVGLMDVQVDLDGVRLSYSAAATWFRDPSTSAVYYFILDLTLARIEDLDEIVTAVSDEPVEDRSVGESFTAVAAGAEKSSDLVCREYGPETFIYPDGPSGTASAGGWEDWLSLGSVVHGSDRITQLDYFGHFTGGHSAWVIPSLDCSCTQGCDSTATLDLSLSQTQEDGFLTQYVQGCHKTVLRPGVTPPTVLVNHGGEGAWGNGAVVWGYRVCAILSGTYCNPLCSNITVGAQLGGGVTGKGSIVEGGAQVGGSVQVTITPDDGAHALTIPIAAQCPPCVKLFEIKAEARGLAEQEVVKATASWVLDSEQGSQQKEKTQLGPDGRVVEFLFDERVPDGAAVRLDASVHGPGGEKVRDCYSVEGDVRGETLVLGLDCTCRPDSQKSTGCNSGSPVSGALELDASVQSPDLPPQAIEGVEVRLTATPPAGTPNPQPIVQTAGPFSVAAGAAATFPLQFPNPVPTGYSWEVRAISPGAPVVCPGTSSGVASGPVVASASCKTTRPLATYSNDPLLDSYDICWSSTKTCEAVDGVEFPWFYPDFEFPERVCDWIPHITEEETTGCWNDDNGVEQ
ncbi:MAG: hypothetical protein MI919_38130, partial [Holophagales bacterium]|nr:hypothetical protein [Holophagales bacterium]